VNWDYEKISERNYERADADPGKHIPPPAEPTNLQRFKAFQGRTQLGDPLLKPSTTKDSKYHEGFWSQAFPSFTLGALAVTDLAHCPLPTKRTL
jgi:hypothetical protein